MKPLAWLTLAVLPTVTLVAGPLRLDRGVLTAGGGAASSARFAVNGSLGQPVAHSEAATAGALAGRAGYWSQTLRWLNAVPAAGTDSLERRAGQGAHVLAAELTGNDTDGDWDPLQVASVATASANGGAVLRDGPWILYQPPAGGGPATDSFTYQVADGLGGISEGTVFVQVAGPAAASASPLAIRALGGSPAQVEVRFQGIAGRSYRVETAAAVNGPWADAGTVAAGTDGRILFVEAVTVEPRFFRLLEP
jgi:Bacterial Ig domain